MAECIIDEDAVNGKTAPKLIYRNERKDADGGENVPLNHAS